MKRRMLSRELAFALFLILLPVSALAAEPPRLPLLETVPRLPEARPHPRALRAGR